MQLIYHFRGSVTHRISYAGCPIFMSFNYGLSDEFWSKIIFSKNFKEIHFMEENLNIEIYIRW